MSGAGPGGPIRDFAAWAATLSLADLPAGTQQRLEVSVLDGLGCGLFGAALPISAAVRQGLLITPPGPGRAQLWGTSGAASPGEAAFANAIAIHAFELDDHNLAGSLHGTSAILPACIALAEGAPRPVSGGCLLTALAIGWEIGIRLNDCLASANLLARGWHTPSIFGSASAAGAAGYLLGLDEHQLGHAISLGLLQSSGLAVIQFAGSAKRLSAGRAAQNGLTAALMAQAAITAPPDVLECEMGGFLSTFAQHHAFNPRLMSDRLGDTFAADHIVAKVFASCGAIHPVLQAVQDIQSVRGPISASTIRSVKVFVAHHAYVHCGWPYVKSDATTAQFNIAYNVAALLLEGNVRPRQFRSDLLDSPAIHDLIDRITVIYDPQLGRAVRARNEARVLIEYVDGEALEANVDCVVQPAKEQVIAKFLNLTSSILPRAVQDEILILSQSLAGESDIRKVSGRLSAANPNDTAQAKHAE